MTDEGLSSVEVLIKTIGHFVPGFFSALVNLPDPRNPTRICYPIEGEIFLIILAFMLHVGLRRNIKFKLNTPVFIENYAIIMQRVFPRSNSLLGWPEEMLPHGDTLNYLLAQCNFL